MIISTCRDVYEPAEDSYLLVNALRAQLDLSNLSVCDMGCGTGVVGLHALQQGARVVFVDNNPSAIACVTHNVAQNKYDARIIQSDLFADVDGVFDIIVCNAPYLPDDPRETDDALTRSIAGGKYGYEWSVRFLQQARAHLSVNGVVLLVASSLSKLSVLESAMFEQGFSCTVVSRQFVGGGEELLVYACTFMSFVKGLLERGYTDITFLSKGSRGIVFYAMHATHGAVVVKRAREKVDELLSSSSYNCEHEARMLQMVNGFDIGPKFVEVVDGMLVMKFVDGPFFVSVMKDTKLSFLHKKKLCLDVLRQTVLLDAHKVDKREFIRPLKNALVVGDGVVLLDFERARLSKTPSNTTQFFEYLSRSFVRDDAVAQTLRQQMIQYKRTYDATIARDVFDALFAQTHLK